MSERATLRSLQRRSRIAGRLHTPAGVRSEDPRSRWSARTPARFEAGALFCCMPGRSSDGHDFAAGAAEAGAAALVVERVLPVHCRNWWCPRCAPPSVPWHWPARDRRRSTCSWPG